MANQLTTMRDAAEWVKKNPVLGSGQPGFEEDTGKLKIGDGVTKWNALPYQDTAPYTMPLSVVIPTITEESLRDNFINVVVAGTNLSAARPPGATVVMWKFSSGVNVGTGGSNVVNRQPGDLIFVAT